MSWWTACWVTVGSASAVLLGVLTRLWVNRHRTSAPGPPPIPLLGNALDFLKFPVLLKHFRDMHSKYGDVFRFYVGPKLITVVTQAEDVQRVLGGTKQRERDPYFIHPLREFLGDGLFTNKGSIWKRHRKFLEPMFTSKMLDRYLDSFNNGSNKVCEQLEAAGGAEMNVYSLLFECVFHTLTLSTLGIGLDELEPDACKRAELGNEIIEGLKTLQKRHFRPWLMLDCVMRLTTEGQEFKRRVALVNNLAKRALHLCRENEKPVIPNERKSVEDVPMMARKKIPLSEAEQYDEVRTIGLAGSETTASALAFALALLGLHPEWQSAAQRELDAVFATGGDYLRPATADELSQLPIIESIIKETLRLFPTAPTIPHFASEDIPLAGGRYVAPRGSCVLVSFFLLHRQPDVFPDPDKFDPGRFLAGVDTSYGYLPFGTGSRKCIGSRFSMLEMKTVLAAVLRRFRLLPGSSRQDLEEIALSVTAHPFTGFRVACAPRDNLPYIAA